MRKKINVYHFDKRENTYNQKNNTGNVHIHFNAVLNTTFSSS